MKEKMKKNNNNIAMKIENHRFSITIEAAIKAASLIHYIQNRLRTEYHIFNIDSKYVIENIKLVVYPMENETMQ